VSRRGAVTVALFAAVSYVPPLLTAPGVVAADTKQYLYLDPGRFLAATPSLWDPSMFGGWVTHQTIGYLWPLGPWYLAWHAVGVPVWVAQRLWIGTLVYAAATGVLVLARLLRLAWYPAVAGAALYALSPYLLDYVNRTSILLAPWAGLGWMTALAILAARRGGWRWPALFALVVATVGGINATALVLTALGPALWLAHAAWVSREIPRRRVLGAAARLAALTTVASAWWIVALAVQAHYGADVLAYSETVPAVSTTSAASEVLRGLGYWLFYGGDGGGRWNSASTAYLTSPGLIALGFGLAAAAVVALVVLAWRERTWLVALVLVGVAISVGAHPIDDPSPLGTAIADASDSTIVLALRSSTRALPLVLLAFALAVSAALTALEVRLPATALGGSLAVVLLAAANLPTLWNGTYVDALLRRPAAIPAYWRQLAAALSAGGDATRALELPGAEFAAYRWGTTNDAILPGLTDRPTLSRDLLPLGGADTMDLLNALDNRFQNGTIEPTAIAPVARLLGAGAIVFRGDTAFERYRTARPEPTWALYAAGVPGLDPPQPFGAPTPNRPGVPMIDEAALSDPRIGAPIPPAAILTVQQPEPIVRATTAAHVTVVDGSGDGLVDAAAAGLLDDPGTVMQSAAFSGPGGAAALAAAVPAGAPLVVTDTNRKRAEQWRGSQDTTGFTEDTGPGLLAPDDADSRLPVFPGGGAATQTLAEQRGTGARAVASSYGEPNAYRPEDRADHAIDGDPTTAWLVGDRGEVLGARLRVDLPAGVHPDHVVVEQPHDRPYNRWITALTVRTPAGSRRVDLTDASRSSGGQRIDLPAPASGYVELEIAATNTGRLANYAGMDAVGFAEVRIDGATPVREVVRPPTDLLDALGPVSGSHPLAFVLTRERVDEQNRWRGDPERTLTRAITVPTDRSFSVDGTAHLTSRAGDAGTVLADLLDTEPDVVATSVLAGSLPSGGRAATDGDPTTAWQTAFGAAVGASVTVRLATSLTVDHLDLQIVNDGRHSVPTALTVSAGGQERAVALPAVPQQPQPVSVPVSFPALTGNQLTVTIDAVAGRDTIDRRYGDTVQLPTAIAELGIPGYQAPPVPRTFTTRCFTDRLTVDGQAVPFRLTGDTAAALAGATLTIAPCGPPLALAAGEHIVQTADSPVAIDRVVLHSAAAPGATVLPARRDPSVRVTTNDPAHRVVTVTEISGPFWLVLGESANAGWHASVNGRDLGPARTVDGGANGWLVTPPPGGGPIAVSLTWRPQQAVRLGLALSAVGVIVCFVAVAVGARRERRGVDGVGGDEPALANPLIGTGGALSWPATTVATLVVAAVAAVAIHPAWAVPIGAATAVSARRPPWRALLTVGAVWAVVLVGLFTTARVVISHPTPGFGWVSGFELANRVALAAVVLLVADVTVERLRH
jgi:arabinofuranan 3-O-arabinosyltransferase